MMVCRASSADILFGVSDNVDHPRRAGLAQAPRGLHLQSGLRGNLGQGQHKIEVIVGGDATTALEATAEAAMEQHMLAGAPLEAASGLHAGATIAQAVARLSIIDMARVQAKWAVIAVMPTRGQWRDEAATVLALEDLVGGLGKTWFLRWTAIVAPLIMRVCALPFL